MGRGWVIKDADRYFYRLGVRRATQGLPFVDEKNPARAFTFSLLFWGAGQSYIGQRIKSVLFQTGMLFFLIGISSLLLYRRDIAGMLREIGISFTETLLSGEILILVALIFWMYNACSAYRGAAKSRRIPFQGVQSRILPALSSLLLPGWGQFMNGQPVKGTILTVFSVLTVFTLVTIPAVLLSWPFLDPGPTRTIIEFLFSCSSLYAPLIPVVSLVSSYDALKVSLDDVKKDSLLDRMAAAVNRFRCDGWLSGIRKLLTSMTVPLVVVTVFVVLQTRYRFPFDLCSGYLRSIRESLLQSGMTLVPDLISRLLP